MTHFRRFNANDVDINHPWIVSITPPRFCSAKRRKSNQPMNIHDEMMCIEHGNAALDVLQSFIDSLVELGRMDDLRLGLTFFEEWRFAAAASFDNEEANDENREDEKLKQRKDEQNDTFEHKSTTRLEKEMAQREIAAAEEVEEPRRKRRRKKENINYAEEDEEDNVI
eukprot:5349362-Ditylum_brightwellii.AAC.1